MKTKRTIVLTSCLALLALLAACARAPLAPAADKAATGGVALELSMPLYEEHGTDASRAISPETRTVYLKAENGTDIIDRTLWVNTGSTKPGDFFMVNTSAQIGLAAGTWNITVELKDENGAVLTSGGASGVAVTAGEFSSVSIVCKPTEAMYTTLALGTGAPISIGIAKMKYFAFPATADTGYRLSLVLNTGKPDVYIFDPTGKRTGSAKNYDYGYSSETVPDPLAFSFKAASSGLYFVGVYGYGTAAALGTLTVSSDSAAPSRPTSNLVDDTSDTVKAEMARAFELLGNGDIDNATEYFARALAEAPTYGPAILGYHGLNLLRAATDTRIVAFARNKLGIEQYPTRSVDLFNFGEGSWINYNGTNMPYIVGEEAADGAFGKADGAIDMQEKAYAFVSHYVTSCAGFEDLYDSFRGALDPRLDAAIQALRSVPSTYKMAFTWDMFTKDWSTVSGFWPKDDHGQALSVVVGRAELLGAAGVLQLLRGLGTYGEAYSLDLIGPSGQNLLAEIFNTYDPTQRSDYSVRLPTYPASPLLSSFLKPEANAAENLLLSKNQVTSALTDLSTAIAEIKADRPGLTLSSTGAIGDTWQSAGMAMSIALNTIAKVKVSIADPAKPLITPIRDFDPSSLADLANWPTTFVPGSMVSINFNQFFKSPFQNLLMLEENGEPVWHTVNLTTGAVAKQTLAGAMSPEPMAMESYLAVDATFGGVSDIGNIPVDNPATRARFALENFGDMNGNGKWDVGEQVYNVRFEPEVEGAVKLENLSTYDFTNLPTNYRSIQYCYQLGNKSVYPDLASILNVMTNAELENEVDWSNYGDRVAVGQGAALRTQLLSQGTVSYSTWSTNITSQPMVSTTTKKLYIAAPNFCAWASLAPVGAVYMTQKTDLNGNPVSVPLTWPNSEIPVESRGSVVWLLLDAWLSGAFNQSQTSGPN